MPASATAAARATGNRAAVPATTKDFSNSPLTYLDLALSDFPAFISLAHLRCTLLVLKADNSCNRTLKLHCGLISGSVWFHASKVHISQGFRIDFDNAQADSLLKPTILREQEQLNTCSLCSFMNSHYPWCCMKFSLGESALFLRAPDLMSLGSGHDGGRADTAIVRGFTQAIRNM
jgi:hypothetical protein